MGTSKEEDVEHFLEVTLIVVGVGTVVTSGAERKAPEGLLRVHEGQVKGLRFGSEFCR